jgi:hypothetical protein
MEAAHPNTQVAVSFWSMDLLTHVLRGRFFVQTAIVAPFLLSVMFATAFVSVACLNFLNDRW